MKKAEAISILAASVRPREAKDRARYDEAVRMAIEALKCSETPKSSEQNAETAQNVQDEDLISRKAAIDALARMMPRSYTPDGSHPADEEIFRAQEVFADCIEALEILPSAQPEILACGEGELNVPDTNVGDMISRQAAIDLFPDDDLEYDTIGGYVAPHLARQMICELPSVQPEIIRCKDCKHWRDDHTCHEHSLVSPMCANEYCSRAERRTDERFDRQTGCD